MRCWSCGEARGGRQAVGGSSAAAVTKGPVGANGQRPLLGGGAARQVSRAAAATTASAPQPPTHRVPGASLAAKAEEERSAGRTTVPSNTAGVQPMGRSTVGASGATGGAHAGRNVDDDGFQLVQGRRRKTGGSGSGSGGLGQGDALGTGAAARTDGDAAADEDAARDRAMEEGEEEDEDAGRADDEVGPAELRKRWLAEVGIAKQLARQGLEADHPALVAACEARDAAERRWREAKEPAPVAKRLGWAHQKLDRAVEIQAATQADIAELEKDYAAKRADLQSRLEADMQRVQKRRQQLAEIQGEAGVGVPAETKLRGADDAAIRRACGTLRNRVAPALSALAEQLDTGTEAWTTVNALLSSLAESQQTLEQAVGDADGSAEAFDIGDDEAWSESHEVGTSGGGHDHGDDGADERARGGTTSSADAQNWAQRQLEQRYRQWQHQIWPHGSDQLDPAMDQDMDGEERKWDHWEQAQWEGPKWREYGHGRWSRSAWADAWEQEHCGGHDSDGGDERPNKQRRQDEPSGQLQAGAPAGAGAPVATAPPQAGPTEAQRAAEAARQHAELLAAITMRAIDSGIQPITESGGDLQLLDVHQLTAWAAEHLPPPA